MPSELNATLPLQPRPWLALSMLCWREMIRFLRQRNRIVAAILTPLVFWLLFGAGLNRSFSFGDHSFREYFYPGTLVMIVLFTAIFTSISIIEDRREGFLQSVLVSPMPRWAMVLGKVLGGSLIALFQGMIYLLLALTLPRVFTNWTTNWTSLVGAIILMFVICLALTALGYVFAWRTDSTQGFHAVMNLVLMPMWLLSGSFFPVPALGGDSLGGVMMHWIMRFNPLTYGVTGLRWLMFEDIAVGNEYWVPKQVTCWLITILFAALSLGMAGRVSRTRTTGDLL